MTFAMYTFNRKPPGKGEGFYVYRSGQYLRDLPGHGVITDLIEEVERLQAEVSDLQEYNAELRG